MVLTALLVDVGLAELTTLMSLPLIVGGACIITSIIGTYLVRLGAGQSIMGALYKGFMTTAILSIPTLYLVTWWVLGDMDEPIGGVFTGAGAFTGMDLFWSMVDGTGVGEGKVVTDRV